MNFYNNLPTSSSSTFLFTRPRMRETSSPPLKKSMVGDAMTAYFSASEVYIYLVHIYLVLVVILDAAKDR